MSDGRVWARLSGQELLSETATYDIDHFGHESGETVTITLTVDMGELELTLAFDPDTAEAFVVAVRDAVVRAKQARIEWETDTGPETGITAREGDR